MKANLNEAKILMGFLKSIIDSRKNLSSAQIIKNYFYYLLIVKLILIPFLIYFNSIFLENKVNHQVTRTIIKLVEKDLSEQLKVIDLEGINKTLGSIENLTHWDNFCFFNKQKVLIKSKKNNCEKLPFLEPIFDKDKNISGYLHVNSGYNIFDDVYYQNINIFIIVFIFSSFMFFLIRKINNNIFDPLAELNTSLTQFYNTKDFHIRAPLKGAYEIGQLASTFNCLLHDMQSKEHQLIKAKNKADEANLLKGEFLASVSHEIRTPMNGIIGTTELLIESLEDKKNKNYANIILRSSENLLSIINDILDFSKIESGKLEIESIPFNLHEEIEDIADFMAIKAIEKNIEIIVAISPYVPERVIGDPKRLRQVIINLMNNAIKFTHEGHVLIEVETINSFVDAGNAKTEEVRFSVVDTGIGISEEHKLKIFERFTQAYSSTTREYGGTGLGLAICKQLIALQGGKIDLESVLGKGSTFHFSINMIVDDLTQKAELSLENTSLILIDENRFFLEHLKSSLRFYGSKVYCVNSVKDSLPIIDQKNKDGVPIDVILISEKLLDSNALNINIINQFKNNIPSLILMTNTLGGYEYKSDIKEIEIDAHIQKPIRMSKLVSLIAMVISDKNKVIKKTLSIDDLKLNLKNKAITFNSLKPNVLVANNDYDYVGKLLTDAGCNVIHVTGMCSFDELVSKKNIDAIIISIEFSIKNNLNFFEIRKSINKKLNNYIPIIAICNDAQAIEHHKLIFDDAIIKCNIELQLLQKLCVLMPQHFFHKKEKKLIFKDTKILLVEDNRVNSQIAVQMLQEFGCRVILIENGKLGFDKFKKNDFDLILMDCQMPVMNGFESTQHIRTFELNSNKKSTPIIALTANAMKGDSELCQNYGMNDYLTKPMRRDDLQKILEKYISPNKASILQINSNAEFIDSKKIKEYTYLYKNYQVDILRFVNDVHVVIESLLSNINKQPIIKISDTLQAILPMCKTLKLDRMIISLEHLSNSVINFHALGITSTYMLEFILKKCISEISKTILFIDESKKEFSPNSSNTNKSYELLEEVVLGLPEEKNLKEYKNDIKISAKKEKEKDFFVFTSKNKINHSSSEFVDLAIYNNIKSIFNSKFQSVIVEYIEDCDVYIENISNALHKKDFELIRENAHPLKSSSHTLGFFAIGSIAKKIEQISKSKKDITAIESAYHNLISAYQKTLLQVDNFEIDYNFYNSSKYYNNKED